jgi:hypothetical protein
MFNLFKLVEPPKQDWYYEYAPEGKFPCPYVGSGYENQHIRAIIQSEDEEGKPISTRAVLGPNNRRSPDGKYIRVGGFYGDQVIEGFELLDKITLTRVEQVYR